MVFQKDKLPFSWVGVREQEWSEGSPRFLKQMLTSLCRPESAPILAWSGEEVYPEPTCLSSLRLDRCISQL